MSTAVWRILCGPIFGAVRLPLALRVAVFVASSGCAAAADDLAGCFEEEGEAAISACTAAISSGKQQDADLAIAHIVRGNAYFIKGDYSGAERDYDDATRLNPKNAVAFYNRGNVFNSVGRYDDAIENYDRAIGREPNFANAFNNRCAAYTAKGDYDRAIQDCNRAIKLNSKRANFVGRGDAYAKNKDYDHAMTDYDEAIRLDANNVTAYFGRCSVLIDKVSYGGAIESCDEALKRQPDDSSARNNRCWARAILGGEQQLKQALLDCDEALRLRPNDPYAFDSRGLVYLKMGNFDKAIANYDQSILMGGERASPLYMDVGLPSWERRCQRGKQRHLAASRKQPAIAEEFQGYGVQ